MSTEMDGLGRQGGLPPAEALLAGTLALMTGHAQQADEDLRAMMAHKIVSNLHFLAAHPQLSGGFRATLSNLRGHWQQQLAAGCIDAAAVHPQWWQPVHGVVQ